MPLPAGSTIQSISPATLSMDGGAGGTYANQYYFNAQGQAVPLSQIPKDAQGNYQMMGQVGGSAGKPIPLSMPAGAFTSDPNGNPVWQAYTPEQANQAVSTGGVTPGFYDPYHNAAENAGNATFDKIGVSAVAGGALAGYAAGGDVAAGGAGSGAGSGAGGAAVPGAGAPPAAGADPIDSWASGSGADGVDGAGGNAAAQPAAPPSASAPPGTEQGAPGAGNPGANPAGTQTGYDATAGASTAAGTAATGSSLLDKIDPGTLAKLAAAGISLAALTGALGSTPGSSGTSVATTAPTAQSDPWTNVGKQAAVGDQQATQAGLLTKQGNDLTAAQAPVYQSLIAQQQDSANKAQVASDADQKQYQDTFNPVNAQVANDAMNWDSAGRESANEAAAGATIRASGDAALSQTMRGLSRIGVSADSGRVGAAETEGNLQTGLATAGAVNNMRSTTQLQAAQMRQQAAQLGQQVAGTANATGSQAAADRSSAANIQGVQSSTTATNAQPGLTATNQAANTYGSAASGGQSIINAGNNYGLAVRAANTADTANLYKGVGTVAGLLTK